MDGQPGAGAESVREPENVPVICLLFLPLNIHTGNRPIINPWGCLFLANLTKLASLLSKLAFSYAVRPYIPIISQPCANVIISCGISVTQQALVL